MEPAHLRDDLKQEVILIVCELPEDKVIKLHTDRVLEFYVVRIILNQAKNKRNQFIKNHVIATSDLSTHDLADDTNQQQQERRISRELEEDLAMEEIENLHWYSKGLIELYIEHGNFRAIQKQTGIPHPSAYKTIQKSLKEIKTKVDYINANPLKK